LLTNVTVPVYVWAAVGLKVTLRLQVLPGATAAVQVPRATVNGPIGTTLAAVMTSGLAPVFVTRTLAVAVLPIRTPPPPPMVALAMVAVVAPATGPDGWAKPVPLTVTLEGDPPALWAMETVAVLAPIVVGANRTLTAQEPPGATAVVQPFVNENCGVGSAPVKVTPDTVRLVVPVLLTVMV